MENTKRRISSESVVELHLVSRETSLCMIMAWAIILITLAVATLGGAAAWLLWLEPRQLRYTGG